MRIRANLTVALVVVVGFLTPPVGSRSANADTVGDALVCATYLKDNVVTLKDEVVETVQRMFSRGANEVNPCQTMIDNGVITAGEVANLIIEEIDEQTGECTSASLDPTCRGYNPQTRAGIPKMMVVVYTEPVEEAPYYSAAACSWFAPDMGARADRGPLDPYIHEWSEARLSHDCPISLGIRLYDSLDIFDGGHHTSAVSGPTATDPSLITVAQQDVLFGTSVGTRGLHNIRYYRYFVVDIPGSGSWYCNESATIQYPLEPVPMYYTCTTTT